MKKGDLARITRDAVPMFHDSNITLSNCTFGRCGELVVVVEPNRVDGYGLFAQVLHPTVGVCYIRVQRLEAV